MEGDESSSDESDPDELELELERDRRADFNEIEVRSSRPDIDATQGLDRSQAPAGLTSETDLRKKRGQAIGDDNIVEADTASSAVNATVASLSIPIADSLRLGDQSSTAAVGVRQSVTLKTIVTDVFQWIGLGPIGPRLPVPELPMPSFMQSLWLAVREHQYRWNNQRPVARPTISGQDTENGTITGKLNATDYDDAKLTYTVSVDPRHGSVVVDADGNFTYSPDVALAALGGRDKFVVTIDDRIGNPPHHYGLLGLIGLLGPVKKTISFAVAPFEPTGNPQDGGPVQGGVTDAATGAVVGSIGVVDPGGNPLTYAVTDGPLHGTVTIDPETGTYTYEPTAAARFAAALQSQARSSALASPAFTTVDRFTVHVSGGQAAPAVLTIDNLPVTPLDLHLGKPIDLGDGQPSYPFSVLAGADGRGYVMDAGARVIRVVEPDGSHRSIALGETFGLQALALSADGKRLYVANTNIANQTGSVAVFDTTTATKITDVALTRAPLSITTAADGSIYVFGTRASSVNGVPVYDVALTRIDGQTNTVIGDIANLGSKYLLSLSVSPDGSRVFARGVDVLNQQAIPELVVVDTSSGGVKTIDLVGQIPDFAQTLNHPGVTPDGKQMYVPVAMMSADRLMSTALAVIGVDPTSEDYLQVTNLLLPHQLGGFMWALSPTFSADSSAAYMFMSVAGEQPLTAKLVLAVLDTRTNAVIKTKPVDLFPNAMAMTADGLNAYITSLKFDENGELVSGAGFVSVLTIDPPGNKVPDERTPAFIITNVDADTGVITGRVNFNDADGDDLTYALTKGIDAAFGVLNFDPSTGAFTFTPTEAARRNAFTTEGTDTVTFTMTGADAEAAVPVDVTLAINELAPAPPPPPPELLQGQWLEVGKYLQSANGRFRLYMQGDGNLVLYDEAQGHRALWASNTSGRPGLRAVMQGDGNLVLYSGSTGVWSSKTNGHNGARLVVQDDGNLVIYKGSTAVWDRNAGVLQPIPGGGGGGTTVPSGLRGDDYPAFLKSPSVESLTPDPYGFFARQCTSFVAFRLRTANGIANFHNTMEGKRFGNANNWAKNARALKKTVDGNPTVGSVAVDETGPWGHVAWVAEVRTNGTIVIEEYNRLIKGTNRSDGLYHVRTLTQAQWRAEFEAFIHF
ncbi:hypothetical protein MPSYJ_23050 [Mycolicibacterium psychrotolerans]|uniref:Peptidase C51 domain-containing protein n=1 Tax=Mycolicibacterium psychrotolerans TaxID=216929 RepID=A0A7I7M9H6_9MYCO|nr:CHAP domain-containing protein [Mycolicibacterium psychrotolerans]BBX68844.1 hypothetical protein MPSYJ_23050 [Mycolicibacterium psychrotolerans]